MLVLNGIEGNAVSDIDIGSEWKDEDSGGLVEITEVLDGHVRYTWEGERCGWDTTSFLRNFEEYAPVSKKLELENNDVDMVNDQDRNKFGLVGRPIGILAQARKDSEPKAVQILNEAVQIMAERGKSYDKSGGQAERSMPKIVAMFNALTGHELTPAQGWKFMACLKLARSEQGEHREDNYLDGAAYFAPAGEEAGEDSK